MAIFSTTGAKFFIGPVNDTADTLAALEALTFIEISEVENIDGLSEAANEISFTSLGDGRERILKGTYKAAKPALTMARDLTDAGQIALLAAIATNNEYAFKIVLDDQPAGGTQPTSIYGRGFVMDYSIPGLNTDGVVMAESKFGCTIGLIYDNAA